MTVTAEQSSEIPAPEEIEALRVEIDQLDAEILRLVKRRSEVSRRIGAARMAAGGPAHRLQPGDGRPRPVPRAGGGGP